MSMKLSKFDDDRYFVGKIVLIHRESDRLIDRLSSARNEIELFWIVEEITQQK